MQKYWINRKFSLSQFPCLLAEQMETHVSFVAVLLLRLSRMSYTGLSSAVPSNAVGPSCEVRSAGLLKRTGPSEDFTDYGLSMLYWVVLSDALSTVRLDASGCHYGMCKRNIRA